MKKVYICGDSFGCSDPDYTTLSWSEELAARLESQAQVINLSRVAASNLLISLQVNRAIEEKADFVIVLGTSVLRDEVKIQEECSDQPLLNRFIDIRLDHTVPGQDLLSYTALNINQQFLSNQYDVLQKYHAMKDLDLQIYRDQCIIENTLQKLTDNGIPFLFDQGGFENQQYGTIDKEYFQKFHNTKSAINLWNYAPTRTFRPYHHIIDRSIINTVADYYHSVIKEKLFSIQI